MKNKFYLLFLFLVFFSLKKTNADVHFIVFGGFSSSKIITDFGNKETIFSEARNFYNFGGGFRFEFGKYIYLQSDVYLTRKGGLEQTFRTNTTDSFAEKVDMLSVDMPLMVGLRLFPGDNDKFAFRVYGGPVVSFLQEDPQYNKIEIYRNGHVLPYVSSAKVFSMQVGTGLDIRRITLDVRYEYAFSPILSFDDFKTKHKIIYFTIGFKLF